MRLVPDESLSLNDGAIVAWAKGDKKLVREALESLSRTFDIDLTLPFRRLSIGDPFSAPMMVPGLVLVVRALPV